MLRFRGRAADDEESQQLHHAVWTDDPQRLSWLLSQARYREYIDTVSGWGVPMTPLRLAASRGSPECVRVLVASGAEVDCLDVKAQTPLFAAVSAGNLECVQELLKAGANPCGSTHNNCTPVLTAARDGHSEILQELLAHGADANIRAKTPKATTNWRGPLYLSAVYGHLECFRTLLLHGADPNYNCTDLQLLKRGRRPQTVLDICLKHHTDPKFLKLLIEFGADLYLPRIHAASLKDHPSAKLLEEEKGKPRSLMSQCRLTIRRQMKQTGHLHLIHQLQVPNAVVAYLQHKNS